MSFELQYFVLFVYYWIIYIYIAVSYIYIYIYIGLRAIAIKHIKANYFDFLFLIINLVFLCFYINYKYIIYNQDFDFKVDLNLLVINISIMNIWYSIVLINKNIFFKKLLDNHNLISLDFKKKGLRYYYIYVILFIIFYELSYFKNLYNSNYYDSYIYCLFGYLHLVPMTIIFLYVMEQNNVINSNYLLLKDRLLEKFWLVAITFILSLINIVVVFVLSLFLIPVVFYLIYYIHILLGITPDYYLGSLKFI
jgi:hypothetical protein